VLTADQVISDWSQNKEQALMEAVFAGLFEYQTWMNYCKPLVDQLSTKTEKVNDIHN